MQSSRRVSFDESSLDPQSNYKAIKIYSYVEFCKFMNSSNFNSEDFDEMEDLIKIIQDNSHYHERYTLDTQSDQQFNHLALTTDELITYAQSHQNSAHSLLNAKSKIKYFLLSCAIEAYNQDFDHPRHKAIYSDPSHDIDDQIALAKTLALNILFGGKYFFQIAGHIPNTSITILKDFMEKIKPIAAELKDEIAQSKIIDPKIKIYLAAKFIQSFSEPVFSIYLSTDILKPKISIGQLSYFGKKFNISPADRLNYLQARSDQDFLDKSNQKYIPNPFSFAEESPPSPINIEFLSKITTDQAKEILHQIYLISVLSDPKKIKLKDFDINLITQGKIHKDQIGKAKGEFNMENLAQDNFYQYFFQELSIYNLKVIMCASDLTKELGFGQFELKEISKDSLFHNFIDDLVGSYNNQKKLGWALNGMPIKEFNHNSEAICFEPETDHKRSAACLSFAGILSLQDTKNSFSSVSFPAARLLNDNSPSIENHQNFATYHMTPLRLIGEMLRKEGDNFLPLSIIQIGNKIIFDDQRIANLAKVFFEFYERNETLIFEQILATLNQHQRLLSHLDLDIGCDIIDLKKRLTSIDKYLPLSQEIFEIVNEKISEIHAARDNFIFYQDFLKKFTETSAEFVIKNSAYDTIIPDLSRILNSQDFETLMGFQLLSHKDSPEFTLTIDRDLIDKIAKSEKADIKEIWKKIKKFKTDLNSSVLDPKRQISTIKHNSLGQSNTQPKKQTQQTVKAKPAVSQFNEQDIYSGGYNSDYGIYLPVKGSKACLSLGANDFTKFINECTEVPQPGAIYLPYFDDKNVARLYYIGKDTGLEYHNNFQIQLHQGKGNIKFAQNFYCQKQIFNPPVINIAPSSAPSQFGYSTNLFSGIRR